jgi:hypothetical protein
MSETVRVCFRIPDSYTDILNLIQSYQGHVVGAPVSSAEYDEFFAWHVDEFVDISFEAPTRQEADTKLSLFFQECEKISLPSAAVTSSVYETIEDKEVTGILYHNETGAFEDIKARTTKAISCTNVPVRQAFYESGMSKDAISKIWENMSVVVNSPDYAVGA